MAYLEPTISDIQRHVIGQDTNMLIFLHNVNDTLQSNLMIRWKVVSYWFTLTLTNLFVPKNSFNLKIIKVIFIKQHSYCGMRSPNR